IQNANTHRINSSLDMNRFYRYIGLVKKSTSPARPTTPNRTGTPGTPQNNTATSNGSSTNLLNASIDILTSIKRIQFNYTENNGTFLPGYTQTPGFIGTLKPTLGYTFGSQSDIRYLAASRGWLTLYPEFNQQYTETHTKQLDVSASLQPVTDLQIDVIGNRTYYENYTENFRVNNNAGDLQYESLTPNTFGNFNISTLLIKTAFSASDENASDAFNEFRANRLTIARRLAQERGADVNNVDADGYPNGFGKNSQAVLLPAFLAAYTGQDASKVKLGAFRNVPIPNWDLKYTGFMKFAWFKKNFRRFSVNHGYRSTSTSNRFRSNLDFNGIDYGL